MTTTASTRTDPSKCPTYKSLPELPNICICGPCSCPNFDPHPEWPQFCNCHDCTARADAVGLRITPRTATGGTDRITPPPTGQPPDHARWTAAKMNVPEIAAAAARRLGKPSPSEHDLSLATRLAALDWAPVEIANLLLWNRSRRHEDTKYPGYYTRTVDRAVISASNWKDRP